MKEKSGWPRFGSVRLRFGDGTVRAVPVFGSGGSSKEWGFCVFQYILTERTVPIPVSVPGKRWGATNGGLRDGGLRKSEDI